jgi:hypothetical protein
VLFNFRIVIILLTLSAHTHFLCVRSQFQFFRFIAGLALLGTNHVLIGAILSLKKTCMTVLEREHLLLSVFGAAVHTSSREKPT